MKKKILITGGTGSFGKTFLSKIINNKKFDEIRIFSRDEEKQFHQRTIYNNHNIKHFIGDIRDSSSLENAVKNVDYIFHAAALKQVPSCELFPFEAVKTNIIGAENIVRLALKYQVSKVIALSTDKAVYPINAMGISKAMMEKIFISAARIKSKESKTKFIITRYGNVMASRGSVIPVFAKKIKNGETISITKPNMTRFLMTLDEAVKLVEYAFKNGNNGELFIQKSPSSDILTLAKAIASYFDQKLKYKIIGARLGEKDHETLITREEMSNTKEFKKYFKVPLIKENFEYEKYLTIGQKKLNTLNDYNSSQNVSNLDQVILKINEISKFLDEQ